MPLRSEHCDPSDDLPVEDNLTAQILSQMKDTPPTGWVARLKHWTGLDRAIAYTVMARFWSASAGIVTVFLIAHFLTPREQGYYYTFSSLVALQIVFELGFSFVILQFAAHERAELTFLPDGRIEGSVVAYSRLASILQKSVRWYSVAALLMASLLLPAGFYFFGTHQHSGPALDWKSPWCLLVLAAIITFQIDPVFSFLEGCGSISQVAHMRLAQAMLGSVLAWLALATHHGLFSPAMVIVGQAIVGLTFLLREPRRGMLRRLIRHPVTIHNIGWRREIWPFQWRIAISWICYYFILQFFNPILFAFQGPIAAGQMGMSLSIATSIGGVGLAWMNTKASPFGNMIARGEIAKLDDLFSRTLLQSTLLLLVSASIFFAVLLIGLDRFPKFAMRVLSPWAFGLLLLTTIMNHIVFCETIYLRAHKREPFLVQSIMVAILLGSSTIVLGKYWGANAVAAGNFVFGGLFGLASGTYIFITKRREWHCIRP